MNEYVIADVFTQEPLSGNPVAVFLDAANLSEQRMQELARELNLSETTFVVSAQHEGGAGIRAFTPVNELPFAGHPILGTAVVLSRQHDGDTMKLETAMGTIPFQLDRSQGRAVSASMHQPVPTWEPYAEREALLKALGLDDSVLPVEVYRNGPRHVYVGLEDVPALSRVQPDQRALAEHLDVATNCFAGEGTHWRMRMFSPAYGVAEDAATGSAAGPLAAHLARHDLVEFGQWIEILQGVEMGRPSLMRAKVNGSADHIESVEVAGFAVVVAEGRFDL
jgi:trans-2,3-dihydro-3-hydroxyanthranilate isomerase